MVAIPAIFGILLCFNVISGYVLIDDEENELIWPTEFHFKGEMINFDTTLKEPFEMWHSSEYNGSRIDFYGGSSKQFYDGNAEYFYSVFPMATSNMSVKMGCFKAQVRGDFDLMPELSAVRFTGQTMNLFDKVVDVWTGKDNFIDGLIREQTLYVFKTDNGFDIPVQHIIKLYNQELGVVESHVVKNYYNFKDSMSEGDITIANDIEEDCMEIGDFGMDFKKDVQMLHPDIPQEVDMLFESYANHHGKNYHEAEMQKRKHIFEKNWRMVHEHNRKNPSYRMELNAFSDKTPEELKYLTATSFSNEPSSLATPFPHTLEEIDEIVAELPQDFDLRMEGAVTPVKNQGECGSCWAFAATATLEGALARVNGDRLVDLSEQSVVDCAWAFNNMGCMGGLLDTVWKYIYANGIPTESEYGVYTAHDGYCNIHNMSTVYKIKGFTYVTPRNPNALKVALYKYGPVSVGIQASEYMLHYSNGIFYDFTCEGGGANHAVTVVGYGVRNGEDYWIVKNSWGESWGEDGYILMSAKKDNCFILDYPYSIIV